MHVREARPRPSVAVLLSLACFLPVALAATSTGSLTVSALTLPPDATSTGRFLGFIHNDAANLTGGIRADGITLCKYEVHYAEIAEEEPLLRLPMSADVQESCFPQTSVTVTLQGERGWIGLRPRVGGMADVTISQRGQVEPRTLSDLGSVGARLGASGDTRQPWFSEVVEGDHLYYSAPGLVVYKGDGELRFLGPTAHVESAENVTEYRTGEETRGGTANAHERIMRWVVIRYDAATVTSKTTTPFRLAIRDVPRLAWDGNATAHGVRGTLHADGQDYTPERSGESAYVDGAFTSSLTPTKGGEAATLDMAGDLRGTSLLAKTAPVPAPVTRGFPAWTGLLILGAVIVTGGAVVLVLQQRRDRQATRGPAAGEPAAEPENAAAPVVDPAFTPPPWGPRTPPGAYLERAEDAASAGRHETAADLYRKAREQDPTATHLSLVEGISLLYVGKISEAMFAFGKAAMFSDTGEPEMWIADCALKCKQDDTAADFLMRALDRAGLRREVLGEIVESERFAHLRQRPDVQAALERAVHPRIANERGP